MDANNGGFVLADLSAAMERDFLGKRDMLGGTIMSGLLSLIVGWWDMLLDKLSTRMMRTTHILVGRISRIRDFGSCFESIL
jgi:hypothetical protein